MLDFYLSECYRADVLGKGSYESARQAFKAIVVDGSQIRKEAQQLLASLSNGVTGKCFIGKKQREYLEYVLE